MPQVVSQTDCLSEVFIQIQRAGDGTRNLRNFQCVRQPGTVMVAGGRNKDLRLMFQAAE